MVNIDPKTFSPYMIRNKISSNKNEFIMPEEYKKDKDDYDWSDSDEERSLCELIALKFNYYVTRKEYKKEVDYVLDNYKELINKYRINVFAYNQNQDVRYVYKATWVFQHCVIGSMEKWNWNMFAGIMIHDYREYGRISVHEIYLIVLSKIGKISEGLEDDEKSVIDRIMDGEKLKDVESLISESLKEKQRVIMDVCEKIIQQLRQCIFGGMILL